MDPGVQAGEESPAKIAYDWDNPWTVHYFEAFNRQHDRYRHANQILVEQARIGPGQTILDYAAGTGRTAESALPWLGPAGHVLCVEPATAMREAGQKRLTDRRLSWSAELPSGGHYRRILCGAAIWQSRDLAGTINQLARLLATDGAVCFNIPGQYLGLADEPGGGEDPLLLSLPSRLGDGPNMGAGAGTALPEPLSVEKVEDYLRRSGLRPKPYSFRHRLSQSEYRDWYKIPVLTNILLPELEARERAARVDEVYERCDPNSWRWERWLGWTAWR